MDEFEWIDSVSIAESAGLGIDLPDWLPERDRQEFERSEQHLIAQYGAEQVKEWLRAHHVNVSQTGEYVRLIPIPPEVRTDISAIHFILTAIDAGQKEGLPILVGDNGAENLVMAEKVRNGPKNRESYTHKIEFQALVIEHKDKFTNLTQLKEIKELDFYFKEYGHDHRHTLRDWLNEVLPGHLKAGRPKKT